MYETQEELKELQLLLNESMNRAGTHIRSIFKDENRLSAKKVCEYLQGVRQSAVATANSRGEPRVSPVDSVFYHGKFYLSTDESSLKVRHLKRNPNVSVTQFQSANPAVIVHGVGAMIHRGDVSFEALDSEWIKQYGESITKLSSTVVFIRVDPRLMLAYSLDAK